MKRLSALGAVVLAVSLATPARAASDITLNVQPTTLLSGETIPLGRVAVIAADDPLLLRKLNGLPLGVAPRPGDDRYITRRHIAMYLARSGIDGSRIVWQGSGGCTVTARSAAVRGADVVAAARDYLLSLPELQHADTRVSVERAPRDKLLPATEGTLTLSASAPSMDRPYGRVKVLVNAEAGGKIIETVPVVFQVTTRKQVVYTTQPIRRNQPIEPSHVRIREITLGPMSPDITHMTSLESVLGKNATRAIRADVALTASMIADPFAIREGDVVALFLRSERVEVATRGLAMRNAHIGEIIPVTVTTTGKRLFCKVTANGEVELAL